MKPRAIGPLALAIVLATCGDGAPTSGWLRVSLSGPSTDNAGVLFAITGGPVDSVRSAFPHLFSTAPGDSAVRVIVAGASVSGVVAEIAVPDVGALALYRATVEQVAAGGTFAQREPGGFRLTVER
jgi:hypothetical protein